MGEGVQTTKTVVPSCMFRNVIFSVLTKKFTLYSQDYAYRVRLYYESQKRNRTKSSKNREG